MPACGRGDLLGRGRHVFLLAADDCHLGPVLRQCVGNAPADPGSAPGNQRDLAQK